MALKSKPKYKRVAQLKTPEDFEAYCRQVEASLPFDATWQADNTAAFASEYHTRSQRKIGNRFCILPMEGWDGTLQGSPTEHTFRRWKNFGLSGAKLLWGCEAVAVQHNGRANPNQLYIHKDNLNDFQQLYNTVTKAHRDRFGTTDDLLVGLQLTHSGRFSRPNDKANLEPQIAYRHPILDDKLGLGENYPLLTDEALDELVSDFVQAAVWAQQIGFQFVDIKHCHGYLGHELLTGYDREGRYGGTLQSRTRLLRAVVEGIREKAPGLDIGVRLSAFDYMPYTPGKNQVGEPYDKAAKGYGYAFGGDESGCGIDLTETFQLLEVMQSMGIELVCITAGSPYYNPHIQRPALFPPSDGYLPPEDPLVGVARQVQATARIKEAFPDIAIVGSAYSYLQEWLPYVGHQVLDQAMADFVGLGRMVLSYPDMPADILSGKVLQRTKICRTFSDCTTAPRNGLISGCFPLDSYYKKMEEHEVLKAIKKNV